MESKSVSVALYFVLLDIKWFSEDLDGVGDGAA